MNYCVLLISVSLIKYTFGLKQYIVHLNSLIKQTVKHGEGVDIWTSGEQYRCGHETEDGQKNQCAKNLVT